MHNRPISLITDLDEPSGRRLKVGVSFNDHTITSYIEWNYKEESTHRPCSNSSDNEPQQNLPAHVFQQTPQQKAIIMKLTCGTISVVER